MTTPGLIQRGDILARLGKALGIKDRGPAPTLDQRVQPVVIVGDARDEPVFGLERPFFTYEIFTGAAGQFPAIELLNPVGSGIDVIIDYIVFSTATTGQVDWRLTGQVLATPTTKATQYRDTTPGQPLVQCRAESLAAVVLGAGSTRITTQNAMVIPLDTRYLPGTALLFCHQVAASTFTVAFYGRELIKPFRST